MPRFSRLAALAALIVVAPATVALHPASAASSPAADPAPIRMTADTVAVTDTAGHTWAPRSDTLNTPKRSTRLLGKDVAGTTDDRLYQVNAWGATSWSIPVATSGRYKVRLLMAEDSFPEKGKRVFSVTSEGATVATDVDIVAAAGFATAHDVTFETQVVDDRLDLGFVKKKDEPLVAGVEVVFVPAVADATGRVRMVAGAVPVTDGTGSIWGPAFGYLGPYRTSVALAGARIGGTNDPELYRTATWGMTGWQTKVATPGRYTVRLLTTEGRWTGIGQRVFDVTAEGKAALTDVDIFKSVGIRTAYAPQFDVEVDDGVLDLGFVAKVDQPTISAIEVFPAGAGTPDPSPTATPTSNPTDTTNGGTGTGTATEIFTSRMVARPMPVTDSAGKVWTRWSPTLGSWKASTKLTGDITGTEDDDLYRANVWGARGYTLPVPAAATYKVRLLMAEDSFFGAGKRVFDVKAEGAVVAPDVDVAAAVGHGAAHDVTFEVPVTDGELNLAFTAKVDQPMISAIEVTSTTKVAPVDTNPRRLVKLAPDSFYTSPITQAPVAEDSAAIVGYIASQVSSRYGGIAAFSAYHYNIAFYAVPAGRRRVTVDYACGATPPPGLYDGVGHFLDVPIPDLAVSAQGTDGAMTIYDAAADQLWAFWQMRHDPKTDRWSACWGGRIDRLSANQGQFPSGYGASASGLALAPGIVSLDDVKRGKIEHALTLAVPDPAAGRFSWPANRTDGTSSNPAAVMEGQRLRLDPTLNLDQYNLTPIGRMVAEAAQKYGFVVADNGGAVALSTEAGDPTVNATGANPWDQFLDGRDWEVMRNFPWDKLQALPKDYGRPGS